jgi:hypothetical protein
MWLSMVIPFVVGRPGDFTIGPRLQLLEWIAFSIAVGSSALPLLTVPSASVKSTGLLRRARTSTHRLLTQLVNVTMSNSALSISAVKRLSAQLDATVDELVAGAAATRTEHAFICCKDAKQSEAWVAVLRRQRLFLRAMCWSTLQRQGEAITAEQKYMISALEPGMRALTKELAAVLEPASASDGGCGVRLEMVTREVEASYLRARSDVYLLKKVEHPIYEHAVRRNTFMWALMHLSTDLAAFADSGFLTNAPLLTRTLEEHLTDMNEQMNVSSSDAAAASKCCRCSPSHCCQCPISSAVAARALRMGLTMACATLWIVVPALSELFNGRGIWVGVTAALVSCSDSGTSVTKCLDRVFGTLLACSYALIVFRFVKPSDGDAVLVVFMSLFIFAVSLFRGGKRPYWAVCAAFTSCVMFFGGTNHVESGRAENFIISRIEMTAIGIGLYLVFEFSLWPTNAKQIVASGARAHFHATHAAIIAFIEAAEGIHTAVQPDHADAQGDDSGGKPDAINYLESCVSKCSAISGRCTIFFTPVGGEPNRLQDPPFNTEAYQSLIRAQASCDEQLHLAAKALSMLARRAVSAPELVDQGGVRMLSEAFSMLLPAFTQGNDAVLDLDHNIAPPCLLSGFRELSTAQGDAMRGFATWAEGLWADAAEEAARASSKGEDGGSDSVLSSQWLHPARQEQYLLMTTALQGVLAACNQVRVAGVALEDVAASWPWAWAALDQQDDQHSADLAALGWTLIN